MSVAVACRGSARPNFWTSPSSNGFDRDSSITIIKYIGDAISKLWGSETNALGRIFNGAIETLNEIYVEYSQVDWDGYGAAAITIGAYEEARKVIDLLPSSINAPEIVPEPSGEIGFEWRRGKGQVFIISVGGKHIINYAGIFGGNKIHGSEYFEETLPSIIIDNLWRLYS